MPELWLAVQISKKWVILVMIHPLETGKAYDACFGTSGLGSFNTRGEARKAAINYWGKSSEVTAV